MLNAFSGAAASSSVTPGSAHGEASRMRLALVGLIESLSQIDRYDTGPAESPCSYHPTCLTLAGQPGVRECGDSIPDGSLLVSMRGLTTPGARMTYADADSTRATWGCPHLPDLPGKVAARHRGMHLLFDRENRESLAGECAQIRPWSTIALTTRTAWSSSRSPVTRTSMTMSPSARIACTVPQPLYDCD